MQPLPFIDRTEDGNLRPHSLKSTEILDIGLQVYREVWREFYEWEPTECQQILDSFTGRRAPSGEREMYRKLIDQLFDPTLHDSDMQVESSTQSPVIMTQYDPEGRGISYPLEIQEISVDLTFDPHPAYESCPPLNQSIFSNQQLPDTVAFVPYGDEEDFPVVDYLSRFQHFAWEEDFDPDSEMIQIETARRLHSIYQLSNKEIDRMGILKPLRESYHRGLLWERSQRDFLRWPGGAFTAESDIQTSFTPAADDLHGRLTSLLTTFCPSLNCLRTLCTTHPYSRSGSFGGGRPKVTNQSMRLTEGEPCGEECFRLTDESYMDKVYWENESDLETLKTILSISPDLFPCQVADLCFKPCREVFVQRSHIYPEYMILDGEEETHTHTERPTTRKVRKPRLDFEDTDHKSYSPLEPCNHMGPCAGAQCECYHKKRHCQLACRCGVKCIRQYPGCTCKRCEEKVCPCLEHRRECLPGICQNCDARGATQNPCQNTKLQRNDVKAVEVKRAEFGLGAFAAQNLMCGDYIGDYVGVLLSHGDADNVGVVARYNQRNYLFEISSDNEEELIDAARAGNATRFLNHAPGANCEGVVLLVNGEHHIGFYTREAVDNGEELFLAYGDNYWIDEQKDDSQESD